MEKIIEYLDKNLKINLDLKKTLIYSKEEWIKSKGLEEYNRFLNYLNNEITNYKTAIKILNEGE